MKLHFFLFASLFSTSILANEVFRHDCSYHLGSRVIKWGNTSWENRDRDINWDPKGYQLFIEGYEPEAWYGAPIVPNEDGEFDVRVNYKVPVFYSEEEKGISFSRTFNVNEFGFRYNEKSNRLDDENRFETSIYIASYNKNENKDSYNHGFEVIRKCRIGQALPVVRHPHKISKQCSYREKIVDFDLDYKAMKKDGIKTDLNTWLVGNSGSEFYNKRRGYVPVYLDEENSIELNFKFALEGYFNTNLYSDKYFDFSKKVKVTDLKFRPAGWQGIEVSNKFVLGNKYVKAKLAVYRDCDYRAYTQKELRQMKEAYYKTDSAVSLYQYVRELCEDRYSQDQITEMWRGIEDVVPDHDPKKRKTVLDRLTTNIRFSCLDSAAD